MMEKVLIGICQALNQFVLGIGVLPLALATFVGIIIVGTILNWIKDFRERP